MSAETVFLTRVVTLGAAGALFALYAALAVLTGRPDPMPLWIPMLAAALAFVLICGASVLVGRRATEQAFDEGYLTDERRAQCIGFWGAVALYPAFTLLLWWEWVSFPVTFAAMGSLTAAIYLLTLVWFDVRGRA